MQGWGKRGENVVIFAIIQVTSMGGIVMPELDGLRFTCCYDQRNVTDDRWRLAGDVENGCTRQI